MSSLLENTSRIATAKESIRQSIISKGENVESSELIDTYAEHINNIKTGGKYQDKEITANGSYVPDEGFDAFSSVNVNVSTEGELYWDYLKISFVGFYVQPYTNIDFVPTDETEQTYSYYYMGFETEIQVSLKYGITYQVVVRDFDPTPKYAVDNKVIYHKTGTGTENDSITIKSTFPNLQYKYITENGYFSADEGYDGIGTAEVNVKRVDFSGNQQFCYMFKNGRFLSQFDEVIDESDGIILDCTGMFHNICLNDQTYRDYDFNNLNLSQCTNFYDCFTGGADWWTVRGKILNFDMSKVDNCSYAFNTCTYLTDLTFKEGASFGGNSGNDSLTLDLTQTGLSPTTANNLIMSLSSNNSGKSRTLKFKENVLIEISDEAFDRAISCNYTLSS